MIVIINKKNKTAILVFLFSIQGGLMDRSGTKYSDALEVLHNLKYHHEITAGRKKKFFLHCMPKCWPRWYRACAQAVCG